MQVARFPLCRWYFGVFCPVKVALRLINLPTRPNERDIMRAVRETFTGLLEGAPGVTGSLRSVLRSFAHGTLGGLGFQIRERPLNTTQNAQSTLNISKMI